MHDLPLYTGLALRRFGSQATTSASADFCRLIPPPLDGSSTRRIGSSPRVRRATFAAYTRRIYFLTVRMVSGFGSFGPLAPMRLPQPAVPIRRATALRTASFRFRLATDTLAVRLTVPTIRVRRGLTPPSHPIHHHSGSKSASHGAARHAWRTKRKGRLEAAPSAESDLRFSGRRPIAAATGRCPGTGTAEPAR